MQYDRDIPQARELFTDLKAGIIYDEGIEFMKRKLEKLTGGAYRVLDPDLQRSEEEMHGQAIEAFKAVHLLQARQIYQGLLTGDYATIAQNAVYPTLAKNMIIKIIELNLENAGAGLADLDPTVSLEKISNNLRAAEFKKRSHSSLHPVRGGKY